MIKLLDILKEAEEQQYKIYCDMDGVLVDFDRGYKDLTHMTPREAEALGMISNLITPNYYQHLQMKNLLR